MVQESEKIDDIRIETTQASLIAFCKLVTEALSAIRHTLKNPGFKLRYIITIRQIGDLICLGVALPCEIGSIAIAELPMGVLEEGADEQ